MNRSKRGKRERATRGERGKVDEGWPRGSKISGFRGTRHTRSRIFGRVRFLERHGSIEGDREHARPLFFFFRSTLDRENSFSQFSAIYRMEMCTSFIFLSFPFLLLSLFATRKRDSRNNYNVIFKEGKKERFLKNEKNSINVFSPDIYHRSIAVVVQTRSIFVQLRRENRL